MVQQQLIVKTIGLTKVFKDFWRRDKVVAVKDLDLEVRRGEVFGLLGPNGSGKSTTIKMLLGLLYPTRGRISILGMPPTDVDTKNRIGYLPEESYLYRFLNASETLQLYARLFRQDRKIRGARIEKLLEMVGLQHQARRRIGEYSKGMARRIGLAQALINDPDFLILDEPTTGLDPIGTQQIKELIRELARRGKTILLSSHLLSDVQDVCDRVCILYGGHVQAEGRINELLRRQDATQITAPSLSEETLEAIRRLIKDREHRDITTIEHPTERLEAFFIRIVRQAQDLRVATSGVQAGGELPDFLSEDQGEQLIGSLVSAADQQQSQTVEVQGPAKAIQPVEDTSAAIVQELLDTRPRPAAVPQERQDAESAPPDRPAVAPADDARTDESRRDVDQALIDTLLDQSERRDRG